MSETNMLHEFADYVTRTYRNRMLEMLNDDQTPWYLREHLSESPNYYTNINLYNMIDTLSWLTRNDVDKKEILDRELDMYFDA